MSTAIAVSSAKVGRDESCPCGSGRKYKRCCLAKEKSKRREREQVYAVVSVPEQKVTDVLKETEVIDVFLSSENRDKFLAAATERTPHENQHLTYHEGGHALLNMLFYNDLAEVNIVPSYDAKTRRIIDGFCKSIEKNKLIIGAAAKMPVEAYLAVQNVIVTLAGSIAERLFVSAAGVRMGMATTKKTYRSITPTLKRELPKTSPRWLPSLYNAIDLSSTPLLMLYSNAKP